MSVFVFCAVAGLVFHGAWFRCFVQAGRASCGHGVSRVSPRVNAFFGVGVWLWSAMVSGGTGGPGGVVGSPQAWVESLPDEWVDKALESVWTKVPDAERRTPAYARRVALIGYLSGQLPGARLVATEPAAGAAAASMPFYSEVLPDRTGYLRFGDWNVGLAPEVDRALADWHRVGISRVVVDLRAPVTGGSLEFAAQLAGRFLPAGLPIFAVRRGGGQVSEPVRIRNEWASPWAGEVRTLAPRMVVVLVDARTAGPAEVFAAALKFRGGAVLVGHSTRGEGADFVEIPLGSHGRLRVPEAEPLWMDLDSPDSVSYRSLLGKPLVPDVAIADSPEAVALVVAEEVQHGKVSPFLTEPERQRMNEAALVAGRNPELEESIRQAKLARAAVPPVPLGRRDAGLRSALDFFKGWEVLRPR